MYSSPTLGESPQHKQLPELSVTLVPGERKDRRGSSQQLSNNSKVCLSGTPLPQKAPVPVAFLLKAQIHPEVTTQPGCCTETEHQQQGLLRSSQLPSRAFPLPSPPFAEGGGTHSTQLWSRKDPASPSGRVTHLATAGSSCGAEYTQPMAGQGGGRQRVQGSCVSAKGAVGGRI